MTIEAGSRFNSYEIVAVLGAGGMGKVYRARDVKLGRDVAIKVLIDAVVDHPDRVARFHREAQLLASLNHPHIAAIYGLEESRGTQALILELVEGPTLAERIDAGSIEMDEALKIAAQIAEALEAAHEKDVIHRDLKPANVKLTKDGQVKVLDFGLAKMLQDEAASPSLSMSPTLSVQATLAGVILGTASYMSPEQARGKAVDRRTDIWAFGCVLFEMLTGKTAFAAGETVSDVLAAILKTDPDWSALPAATPTAIRRLLRRCLTKDPRERLHDIADARIEIRDAGLEETAIDAIRTPSVSPRNRLAWGLVSITSTLSVVLAVILFWSTQNSVTLEKPVYRSAIVPPAGDMDFGGGLALSPDGKVLAFVGRVAGHDMLWVRPLDALEARLLAGTEGADSPFWSPDSRHLAFMSNNKLKRIDISGGPVITVCDLEPGAGLAGGTWNEDDVILLAGNRNLPLLRVAATGGAPAAMSLSTGKRLHDSPFFLPGGKRFVYHVLGLGPRSGTYLGTLDSTESTQLLRGTFAKYAQGHLIFMQEGTLMAQPFDAHSLRLNGPAIALAEEIQIGGPPAFAPAVTVSQNGLLAYQTRNIRNSRLVWLDRAGKEVDVLGDPDSYGYVQLSPDGKSAAVTVSDSTTARRRDIWIYDVTRGVRTRFTSDPRDEFSAVWSPDGSRVTFGGTGKASLEVYEKRYDGTGEQERFFPDNTSPKFPLSWSHDRQFLLYQTPSPLPDLWVFPLSGDRTPFPFMNTRFDESAGQFSPGSRWIAYSSNETGRREVYIAPFQRPGRPIAISTGGGNFPRWRRDGKEMFYLTPDNKLISVSINDDGKEIRVGDTRPLFEAPFSSMPLPYDVTADGQRFLVSVESREGATPITLVVNWTELVNK